MAGEEIDIKSAELVDTLMQLLALHKVKGNLTVILILSKGFQNKIKDFLKKHDGGEVFNL